MSIRLLGSSFKSISDISHPNFFRRITDAEFRRLASISPFENDSGGISSFFDDFPNNSANSIDAFVLAEDLNIFGDVVLSKSFSKSTLFDSQFLPEVLAVLKDDAVQSSLLECKAVHELASNISMRMGYGPIPSPKSSLPVAESSGISMIMEANNPAFTIYLPGGSPSVSREANFSANRNFRRPSEDWSGPIGGTYSKKSRTTQKELNKKMKGSTNVNNPSYREVYIEIESELEKEFRMELEDQMCPICKDPVVGAHVCRCSCMVNFCGFCIIPWFSDPINRHRLPGHKIGFSCPHCSDAVTSIQNNLPMDNAIDKIVRTAPDCTAKDHFYLRRKEWEAFVASGLYHQAMDTILSHTHITDTSVLDGFEMNSSSSFHRPDSNPFIAWWKNLPESVKMHGTRIAKSCGILCALVIVHRYIFPRKA